LDEQDGVEEMKRALLLFLLLSCTAASPAVFFDNGVMFKVELAQTPAEKSKGLMYRAELSDDAGMLFVFEKDAPRSFWMKNTLIPLDMIFISSEQKVVEIKSSVQPCAEDPCPSYQSVPAMYVLEISGGLAEKKGISVGSLVTLKLS
jgi:hypothetical protein